MRSIILQNITGDKIKETGAQKVIKEIDELLLEKTILQNNLECPRVSRESEDPTARGLHADALTLFRRANTEYKSDANKTYAYICINNTKRSVEVQSDLYKKWRRSVLEGGNVNRANLPGNSYHEYGFAIDIKINSDYALIKRYLEQNGIKKGASRFHFEAEGSDKWNSVTEYKRKVRSDYSVKVGDRINQLVRKEYFLSNERDSLEKDERELNRKRNSLQPRKKDLDRRRSQLSIKYNEINELREKVNKLEHEMREAKSEYTSFKYTTCPEGNLYENCRSIEHKPYRDTYDNKKRALRRTYESKKRNFDNNNSNLTLMVESYNADREDYIVRRDKYLKDVDFCRERADDIKQRKTKLEEVIKVVKDMREEIDINIKEIQEVVNTWR